LPVDVRGSEPKNTAFGALNRAVRSRTSSISSSGVADAPGRSSTNATGTSLQRTSPRPTTALSSTAGWCARMRSISTEATFSPPVMMMSFARSFSST
jgi:hypothetical protein